MGKVQNQDLSQFDRNQWVEFLKEGAYRGAKINKVAKRLDGNRFPDLIKDANEIKLTYDKTKTITIKLAKLLKKHDDWTFSRLMHNVKMCFSSTYEKDFNARIEKLADGITKSGFHKALSGFVNNSSGDVKRFFYANQKIINGATGDQQVQDDLFKLAGMAKDPNLAHLIAAKATGAMPLPPHMHFGALPAEIQSLIYAKVGPLLTSAMRNQWINDNHVCLNEIGCKTADEAIQHALDHGLTSVNLSAFKHVNIDELKKCTELKKLSLNTYNDLSDLGKNLSKLESLTLGDYNHASEIVEILEGHKNLKNLEINRNIYGEIAKAIANMDDLEGLSLTKNKSLWDREIVKMLEKHTNLRRLNLGHQFNDKVVKAIVNLEKLESLALCVVFGSSSILEILKKHTQLRSLRLSGKVDDQDLQFIEKLDKLEHLTLPMNKLFKMNVHPNVQTLETFGVNITMKQLEDVISKFPKLKKLVCLDRNTYALPLADRRLLMKNHPHIQFIY